MEMEMVKMLEELPEVTEKEGLMKLNRKWIRTCLLRKANKMEENQ